MIRIVKYTALATLICLMNVAFGQTSDSVTIDLAEEYQHISGFGRANIPNWIDDLNDDQVDKAFGNAPGQGEPDKSHVPTGSLASRQPAPGNIRAFI